MLAARMLSGCSRCVGCGRVGDSGGRTEHWAGRAHLQKGQQAQDRTETSRPLPFSLCPLLTKLQTTGTRPHLVLRHLRLAALPVVGHVSTQSPVDTQGVQVWKLRRSGREDELARPH